MSDSTDPNVKALTASIQEMVTQLLAGGSISAATTSIKDAIEASATRNATAIYDLTASTAEAAASAKINADAATARTKPPTQFALHPGTHNADGIFDYSTKHGGGLYAAATAALPGTAWDHTLGNTLGLSNTLEMRAAKSVWSSGAGDILSIEDDGGTERNLLTKYGLLTVANINTHFATYKMTSGRQLQNSAQLTE
jgi:hypothetical protein